MILVGPLLILFGFWLLSLAIRSLILSAQIGQVAEEGREEAAYGDCFPAPLVSNNEGRN